MEVRPRFNVLTPRAVEMVKRSRSIRTADVDQVPDPTGFGQLLDTPGEWDRDVLSGGPALGPGAASVAKAIEASLQREDQPYRTIRIVQDGERISIATDGGIM